MNVFVVALALLDSLVVAPEDRCAPYNRSDYPYSQSVELQILARDGFAADASGVLDRPYPSPYQSGVSFLQIKGPDGTDIEHMVSLSEAHDSGLCAASNLVRRNFARDLDNLTLASPHLNRRVKVHKDAGEWMPEIRRCEFASTVVQVKRKYGLTVDATEADTLRAVLEACVSAPKPVEKKVETRAEMLERLRNEQIARLKAWREQYRKERQAAEQRRLDSLKAVKEQEYARIKALRRPPARVWRVGSTLFWDPPETADELRPDGYWISEQRADGSWTKHGDYLPHTARETRWLINPVNSTLKVETWYPQMSLYESYPSDPVPTVEGEPWWLVGRVRFYASDMNLRPIGRERWRRVLAAFGAKEALVGWAGRPPVGPLDPPMTAAEAQIFADKGWERWIPVARALHRLEKERRLENQAE